MKIHGGIILLIILSLKFCFGQGKVELRSKDFYLISSFDFSNIGRPDSILIDTTLQLYHTATHDTTRIILLGHIIEECVGDNFWEGFNDLMIHIAKKIIAKKDNPEVLRKAHLYFGKGLNNKGYLEIRKGNMENAAFFFKESADYFKKHNFQFDLARSYSNWGLVQKKSGNLKGALDLYHKSLKIRENLKDKKGIAYCYHNIGGVLCAIGNKDKALTYLNKSLKIKYEIGDEWAAGYSLYIISEILETQGNFRKALEKLFAVKKIWNKIENIEGTASVKGRMGRIFLKLNENDIGLQYLYESLALFQKLDNPPSSYQAYQDIADFFFKTGDIKKATNYGTISLGIANKNGEPNLIQRSALLLSKIYRIEENYKEALSMLELHKTMKDSVLNEKNKRNASQYQLNYEFNKTQTKRETEHNNQLFQIGFFAGGILIIIITFTLILSKRLKITRKQNKIIELQKETTEHKRKQIEIAKKALESKNKELTDSINYAERIQRALLKSEEHITEYLPPHFIIFLPKDIVSGDFYWAIEKNGIFYFAVADCTGHGVPGAFMSMLGIAFLNEINAHEKLLTPAEILNKLRSRIIKELNQTGEIGENKEGMDISLCMLNLSNNKLVWAGANNPIWIVRNQEYKGTSLSEPILEEIKGDKQPIGFNRDMRPFTNHQIQLNRKDFIYLFTDGYPDQFGGSKGKKLKYKPFKKLILENNYLPLDMQKNALIKSFYKWKGEQEQIDDICMFCIQIT